LAILKKRYFIIILSLITLILFHNELFGLYYDFLVENDNINRSDAIFILGGGSTGRTAKAIELYKNGYAKKILYSKLRDRSSNECRAGDYKSFLLIKSNIFNFESLHYYKNFATSTFDEAYEAIHYAKMNHLKSMILVTELTHTRRAKYAFEKVAKLLDYNLKTTVCGVKEITYFDYNRDNWWKNPYLFSYFMIAGMKFLVYIISNNNATFIDQQR